MILIERNVLPMNAGGRFVFPITVLQHSWRGDFDCKDNYHQASSSIHREDVSNAKIAIMKRPPAFVGRTCRVMTTIILLPRLSDKK